MSATRETLKREVGQAVASASWSPTAHTLTITTGSASVQIDLGRNLADAGNAVKGLRVTLLQIEDRIAVLQEQTEQMADDTTTERTTVACSGCGRELILFANQDGVVCPVCGIETDCSRWANPDTADATSPTQDVSIGGVDFFPIAAGIAQALTPVAYGIMANREGVG